MENTQYPALLAVGSKHPTVSSGMVTVLEYDSIASIKIRFDDTGTILNRVSGSNLRKGLVLDPCVPTLCGIGYMGVGVYSFKTHHEAYAKWCAMICRVYKVSSHGSRKSYVGCSVHKAWHNFQNFAEWFYRQPFCRDRNYDLDKDLLVAGNKEYGPLTCLLLPRTLNLALSTSTTNKLAEGVYRQGRKFVAETRMRSALSRRIGSFETLEEASLAYLRTKWQHVLELSKFLRDAAKITDDHFKVIQTRFDKITKPATEKDS